MIYLETSYGLANRMRAVASALRLCIHAGATQNLTVIWPKNKELMCDFADLFHPLPHTTVLEQYPFSGLVMASAQPSLPRRAMAAALNRLAGLHYCVKADADFTLDQHTEQTLLVHALNGRNLYIKTCAEFGDISALLRNFKPVPELQKAIETRKKDFNQHTVGLHVRRSDHRASIANSPISLFVTAIREELLKDRDTRFYLSTDDQETVRYLQERFGDRILCYPKNFSRDSAEGIRDALVDMYCLAATHRIYGSFNSSFSDIASRISQIDLNILKLP